MKQHYLSILMSIFSTCVIGQQLTLVTAVQNPIIETSGLISLNGKLITHNDSGGNAELYELDSITGNSTRTVSIENATNADWEDICSDDQYVYIADFGNNNGTRTDLKVYRISIIDYLSTPNDSVTADTINFSYSDQIDFTASQFSTNFDAEAIIAYNDSLYIFTKNWGNNRTNIYSLPKKPGNYQALKVDSINTQGLVTGGTYNISENRILLSGYTYTGAFIVEISGFVSSLFSSGMIERYSIVPPSGSSMQIESITNTSTNQYYLTAEESSSGSAGLYRLTKNSVNTFENSSTKIEYYPNPTSNFIKIKCDNFSKVEVYALNGELLKTVSEKSVDISDLNAGVYLLIVLDSSSRRILSERIVVE